MITNVQTRAPLVVGVDDSDAALHAVAWAAREALRRHATLQLVHAVLPEEAAWVGYGGMGLPPEYFVEARRSGKALLSRARQVAEHTLPSTDVSTDIQENPPQRALLDLSRSAEMLVLGSRGAGGFAGLLVGSTAGAVSAHAECPVVVTRGQADVGPDKDRGPVVVGVDGSALSEDALAWGFDFASRRTTGLVAVHVWSDLTTTFSIDKHAWAKAQTEEEVLLSQRLAGWRGDYPDVPVAGLVYPDRPAHALLTESHAAQLLVVGSRGRGGFSGLLLGSTSRALLHHATCPVMVVRSKPESFH